MIGVHRRLRDEGLRRAAGAADPRRAAVRGAGRRDCRTVDGARARGDDAAPTPLDPPLEVDVGVGDELARGQVAPGAGALRHAAQGSARSCACARPSMPGRMTNLPMSTLSNAELVAADPDVWIEVDGRAGPELRRDPLRLRRGRRRHRPGRPHRQGRGPRRHRLQVAKASSRSPSCRSARSVDPDDEVSLGEEVDALGHAEGGRRRPPDPLEEAGAVREGVEAHRGCRRERRARRGPRSSRSSRAA